MRKWLSLVLASIVVAADVGWTSRAHKAVQGESDRTEVAVFAGGCFWCVEADFDKVAGVKSTTSGYTGGRTDKPTYEQVSAGGTGHIEAVQVEFDPAVVTYEALLEHFWKNHRPVQRARPVLRHRRVVQAGDLHR